MCLGASGTIFSGVGVGYLQEIMNGEWTLTFIVLGGLAGVASLMMLTLWNARPKLKTG